MKDRNKKIVAVMIPQGSIPINLGYNTDGSSLWFKYTNGKPYAKELPNGISLCYENYKILGFMSDVDDKQLELLLPETFDKRRWSHLNDIVNIDAKFHHRTVLIYKNVYHPHN